MAQNKDDKVAKSYQFFLEKEKANEGFTKAELEIATGWTQSTIKTYLPKKWDTLLEKRGEQYFAKGIKDYTEQEYNNMMSQVNANSQDPFKPKLEEKVERLVVKAQESALLALDIYNRPATMFKSEGFIVMMIIAWTALLHAIFEKNQIKYNYTEEDGTDKMRDGDLVAWELSECLKQYYKNSNNAIRENIRFMTGLRHKIEHRFAPKIDDHIAGECQALLLNFDELLTNEFGSYYSLKDSLVFPLQTSNLSNTGKIDVIKKFQGKHYDEIKEYIDVFRKGISDEIYNDMKFSFQVFLIPKTANRRNSSDMAMEFIKYDPNNPEEMAAMSHLVTAIKEKKIKTGNPDGLKPKQVIEKVKAKIGKEFNQHNHTQAWKYYNARPKDDQKEFYNDYCYCDTVNKCYIYTPTWVDFLVTKLNDEEEYKKLISFKI